MCEDSDSEYVQEIDATPSDSEEIMSDLDDDEVDWGTDTFMPDLLPNEELSEEKQEKMTKHFSKIFDRRYPAPGLSFCQGSFDDSLNQSILNLNYPRPLIFYIRHNKSIADNTFCINFLCSKKIVNYLHKKFIIWPWDRTNMNHYRQFLKLLIEKVGSEVASRIASYSYQENQYPLLVCLLHKNDQYTVAKIIDSNVLQEDMVLFMLWEVCYNFDHRNDQDSVTIEGQNGKWYIPNSHLTAISSQSDQFQTIINSLNITRGKIITISTIENLIWSIQYSTEKKKIDDRIGHNQNEKELFYGCPLSMARTILKNGFDDDSHRIHGDKYGHGFYFSSKRELCEKYTVSDELKNDKKAIIICRIVTDRNHSNEYNSNIFVVNRNEQILPEYLVVYHE